VECGNQDTRFLKTLLQADALAILPSERVAFTAGEEIAVHVLSNKTGILESYPAEFSTSTISMCLAVLENSL